MSGIEDGGIGRVMGKSVAEDKPRWLEADDLLDRISDELRDRHRQIEMQMDRLVGEKNAIESVLVRIGPSNQHPVASGGGMLPLNVPMAPPPNRPVSADGLIERRF